MIQSIINLLMTTVSNLLNYMQSMYITGNVSVLLFITVAILVPLVFSILLVMLR